MDNIKHTYPVSTWSLVAFWLLGLCNNYGYVVMLSAAHDIISQTTDTPTNSTNTNGNSERKCLVMSTGTVLLADIIPSLIIKVIAPFFPLVIHVRMILIVGLNILGFVLVSQAKTIVMALTGVVSIAVASGLGEASILAYMSFYRNKNVLSAWSSGTGGAGFFGSLSYMLLAYLSESNRSEPLLIFLIVPILMSVSFWLLLGKPFSSVDFGTMTDESQAESVAENDPAPLDMESSRPTLALKIKAVTCLLKYMMPFGLVYLFEYFINQGLVELIHFDDLKWISTANQYVSYQLVYQIGVFASRSSINLITINNTWMMAVLQFLNVVIITLDAIYGFIPWIYVVWALILWEGILGGASYVNTYNRINVEVAPEKREFSMGINSFADAVGISLAGVLAIPVHNLICKMPIYLR